MATRRASDRDPELDQTTPAPELSILAGGHPNEYVRVRHPRTGDHYSTTRVLAHKAGATLLPNHDAADKYGKPLPRKPHTKES